VVGVICVSSNSIKNEGVCTRYSEGCFLTGLMPPAQAKYKHCAGRVEIQCAARKLIRKIVRIQFHKRAQRVELHPSSSPPEAPRAALVAPPVMLFAFQESLLRLRSRWRSSARDIQPTITSKAQVVLAANVRSPCAARSHFGLGWSRRAGASRKTCPLPRVI